MSLSSLSTFARYLLSFELLLGGQTRLTSLFTPTLTKKAYSKAEGYRQYLPIIPSQNATQHTQITGALMLISGLFLLLPRWNETYNLLRNIGAGMALALPLMGVYSQMRMGVPYWLPIVNTGLAGMIIWGEGNR